MSRKKKRYTPPKGGFVLEKGVPLPPRKRGPRDAAYTSRKTIFPFAKMRKGDSFFVPGRTVTQMSAQHSAGKALSKAIRGTVRFAARNVMEKHEGKLTAGVRIWCIEYKPGRKPEAETNGAGVPTYVGSHVEYALAEAME